MLQFTLLKKSEPYQHELSSVVRSTGTSYLEDEIARYGLSKLFCRGGLRSLVAFGDTTTSTYVLSTPIVRTFTTSKASKECESKNDTNLCYIHKEDHGVNHDPAEEGRSSPELGEPS